ncbi:hypothetical protein Ddc_24577 [Ditylenchus destructor]|nr:hypothetical protein Ddc_24577 [Ditylenchus destructor]
MSQSSFVFKFNINDFTSASSDFPKSNAVELDGSTWCLGVEKSNASIDRKSFDVFLTCERGTVNEIYSVNMALILRGTLIDLLITRTYNFEPMDLEMSCFKIDVTYILDRDNGFVKEDGECEIMAEISVRHIDSEEDASK